MEPDFDDAYNSLPQELFPPVLRESIHRILLLKQAGKITETAFIGLSILYLESYDENPDEFTNAINNQNEV